MSGSSIRDLVKKHGYGINIRSYNSKVISFKVLGPSKTLEGYVEVEFKGYGIGDIIDFHESTNDYYLEE